MIDKKDLKDTEYLILVLWRLGQLKELGMITGGKEQLTNDGFDIALDFHEKGYRYDKEELSKAKIILDLDEHIIDLLRHIQEIGYETMKKNVEVLMSSNSK